MTTPEIAAQLRTYLVDSFLDGTTQQTLQDHDDLFKLLDSLQVLRMVVQLEALFDVRVHDSELTAENLGSVARVAAFVACKRESTAESISAPTAVEPVSIY